MSIFGNPVMMGGSGGNIQPLSVTQNGTYTASGGVDGYSPVTVNVSGGVDIGVSMVGHFGGGPADTAVSLTVTIDGYNGKYALISVMHRDTLTAPADCTLLDSTTYTDSGFTQMVSVFKCLIDSASKTLTFQQASSARISATVWVLDTDFTLTKVSTSTFQYYLNRLTITSSALTYFTFSAPTAQTVDSNKMVWGVSNGAWLCQPNPPEFQLRHFTGMIPPSSSQKSSWLYQNTNIDSLLSAAAAEVVVYAVSAA